MSYRLNREEETMLMAACYGDERGLMTRPPLIADQYVQVGWLKPPSLWDKLKQDYVSEDKRTPEYISEHCEWRNGEPELVRIPRLIKDPWITGPEVLWLFDNINNSK